MRNSKALSVTFLSLVWCVCGITTSFAQETTETNTEQTTALLKQVEVRFVCMQTNKAFDKEQVPVTIDGVVYFGCCDNCNKTLSSKEESRYATDPVSKKRINKAEAVVGAAADNSIYYFESVENLKAFDPEKHLVAEK